MARTSYSFPLNAASSLRIAAASPALSLHLFLITATPLYYTLNLFKHHEAQTQRPSSLACTTVCMEGPNGNKKALYYLSRFPPTNLFTLAEHTWLPLRILQFVHPIPKVDRTQR